MKIILIAPSGGGKGTLARFLRNDLKIPHISTGDILRNTNDAQIQNLVRNGIFVPDDCIGRIVKQRINEPDCANGFILDGFPRNICQAKLLDELGVIPDLVVDLVAADEVVLDRMRGRWVCRDCSANHNEKLGAVDKCRNCNGETYQREDDKEDKIRERLAQYRAQEVPLRDFYESKGILLKITSGETTLPSEIFLAVKEYLWAQEVE